MDASSNTDLFCLLELVDTMTSDSHERVFLLYTHINMELKLKEKLTE